MAVRINGDRHVVEFQFCGKRVHRRVPRGITLEQATALEKDLRRSLFRSEVTDKHADDKTVHEQWLTVANMLLSATGIQPRPGVYFLCNEGKLVYIGQSKNVACRLAGHRGKGYDKALMIELPIESLRQAESYLIKMLQPALNVA